jgi:hypothetical protein
VPRWHIVRRRIFEQSVGVTAGAVLMTRGSIRVWAKAVAALAALLLTAQAPSPKVERIEVARPGTYEIEVRGAVPDMSVATGNRVEAKAYKSLKVGNAVEAQVGTVIGAELTIVGSPRRAKVPLKVVWRYPAPGLTNPDSKETKTTDEYFDIQLVGEKFPIFWGLTQDWHLVPGTWTLEVWHFDRKLVTQLFEVKKP